MNYCQLNYSKDRTGGIGATLTCSEKYLKICQGKVSIFYVLKTRIFYPVGYWGTVGGTRARNKTINYAWSIEKRSDIYYFSMSLN